MPRFQGTRILLKLSGEALAPPTDQLEAGEVINLEMVDLVAMQIAELCDQDYEFGIVVGGGNIWRGLKGKSFGLNVNDADHMGMLATVINSLALKAALVKRGVPSPRVMSSIPMDKVCEPWIPARAVRHLEKSYAVIAAAGLGEPNFTTDTAAAQRAIQIQANILLKGTHAVDGVYTDHPDRPGAERYLKVSFEEVHQRRLEALDRTAFALCEREQLPIIVFNVMGANSIIRAVHEDGFGTLVHP